MVKMSLTELLFWSTTSLLATASLLVSRAVVVFSHYSSVLADLLLSDLEDGSRLSCIVGALESGELSSSTSSNKGLLISLLRNKFSTVWAIGGRLWKAN